MVFIELYSGHGSMSASFEKQGAQILSIDIRKRKGVCVPVLQKDILKLVPGELVSHLIENYDISSGIVFWAGVPCPAFSYAAGNKYFENGKLRPELSLKSTRHIKKVMRIIEEINPDLWFIENPRGQMRHCKFFVDWLVKQRAMTKELTYSSYGSSYPKPTNLFTNALTFLPRHLTPWGKGAKYPGKLNNLSTCQRQMYPVQLCDEVALWCQEEINERFGLTPTSLEAISSTI